MKISIDGPVDVYETIKVRLKLRKKEEIKLARSTMIYGITFYVIKSTTRSFSWSV